MPRRRGAPRKRRISQFGDYLTRKREQSGKTQQDIASEIGKSRSYVCKLETGQRQRRSMSHRSPSEFLLYQLAQALDADIAEVLDQAECPQLLLLFVSEEERQELVRRLCEIRRQEGTGT